MARQVLRTKTFAVDAASFILAKARDAISERDQFRIALSGGNTPRAVYAEMAKRDAPWQKFLFTFSDERCVPPQSEQSNFKMAREALFQPALVPDSSILRMRGEIEPAVAPYNTGSHTPSTRGSCAAFCAISGPMPAGSPSVIAIRGFTFCVLRFKFPVYCTHSFGMSNG